MAKKAKKTYPLQPSWPTLFVRIAVATATLGLGVAGCNRSTDSDYQIPQVQLPADPAGGVGPCSATGPVAPYGMEWWQVFSDEGLNRLIAKGIQHNLDLAIAFKNLEKAQELDWAARSSLMPSVATEGSMTRGTQQLGTGDKPVLNTSTIGLKLSYQLDIWGKLHAATVSARARMLQQQSVRDMVYLTLTTGIAQNYFSLQSLHQQHDLLKQMLADQEQIVDLTKAQLDLGAANSIDLQQEQSRTQQLVSRLTVIDEQSGKTRSILAILLGLSPQEIMNSRDSFGIIPNMNNTNASINADVSASRQTEESDVMTGGWEVGRQEQRPAVPPLPDVIPSRMVKTRPDILAAEQRIVAAHGDLMQARAAYFPDINIITGLGMSKSGLSSLLSGLTGTWGAGINFSGSVFNFGGTRAMVRGAEANKQAIILEYRKAIATAFAELAEALNAHEQRSQKLATSWQDLLGQRHSADLYEFGYELGRYSQQQALQWHQKATEAELRVQDDLRQAKQSLVDVIKALGGSYYVFLPSPTPTISYRPVSNSTATPIVPHSEMRPTAAVPAQPDA